MTKYAWAVLLLLPLAAFAAEDDPTVVAKIGEESVTLEELDRTITARLIQMRQQKYDLRRGALLQLIATRLFEREAASRDLAVEDLFKTEVELKAGVPTEREIQAFYDRNKARVTQLRGKTLEESKTVIEQMLRREKMVARQQAYIEGLMEAAGVKLLLQAPRLDVPVPAGEPARGPEDAPVTVVQFSDYQCGFCKQVHPAIEEILAEYAGKVRFVYRDYALHFHQRAFPAAKAARCAGDQGKYWEYHNDLLEVPSALDDADLKNRAVKLNLDPAAFNECYASDRHDEAIDTGLADGKTLGVTGTPTFFINGRMMVGLSSKEDFTAIVDEELAARKKNPDSRN